MFSHSQLDEKCPVFATTKDFLLQLFSSTSLSDTSCPLYVLYQFVLRRPKLNAGGTLLPELVQFYSWLHNELSHTVTLDWAKTVTIGGILETYLKRRNPEDKKSVLGLFKTVSSKCSSWVMNDKHT